MNRASLLAAVAYTAALATWTIGRLSLGDVAQSTGFIAAGALLITQCILSALITPWLAYDTKPGFPTGILPLLVAPWPLLLLLIEISGMPMMTIVTSQVWVGGLIFLSYCSARGLLRILREGQLRTMALTVLQLAPAIALWAGQETWVPWFTG